MTNIPLFKVFMSPNIKGDILEKFLHSGYIGQGKKVDEFEEQLSTYFSNHPYVTTVNSGTSALHLALKLLSRPQRKLVDHPDFGGQTVQYDWPGIIPQHDEILASPLTCTASNVPIALANYKIKWVDINPFTLNMDLDDLERKISPTTKAIILPYWGGYPTNLDRIAKIQAKAKAMYGFKPALIEDAAHAFGAKYKNKFIGTHGHITMFSLQAIKHITSVDGGVLMLPTPDLYKRSKLLRWYGIDRESPRRDMRCEDPVHEFGTKWHMNDLNALIGSINLQHADEILSKHRANAAYYDEHLNNITGLTQLVYDHEDRQSSYWLYSMHVDNREGFTRYMEEKGIATSRVHERNDLHPDWAQYRTSLPSLEQAMKTYISIPVGWWVTPEQREYIVETIKAGW